MASGRHVHSAILVAFLASSNVLLVYVIPNVSAAESSHVRAGPGDRATPSLLIDPERHRRTQQKGKAAAVSCVPRTQSGFFRLPAMDGGVSENVWPTCSLIKPPDRCGQYLHSDRGPA